jgi:prepilin-type N-terminal cleavage/methylation domain-containing protein
MRSRGFTLVEVLIALFVVAMLITVVQSMIAGIPAARLARDQSTALKVANNEIESIRAGGYSAVPATGSFSDSLLSSIPSGAGTVTTSDFNAKTKQVVVNVSWQEAGKTQSLSLSTLVTQTGGLP